VEGDRKEQALTDAEKNMKKINWRQCIIKKNQKKNEKKKKKETQLSLGFGGG